MSPSDEGGARPDAAPALTTEPRRYAYVSAWPYLSDMKLVNDTPEARRGVFNENAPSYVEATAYDTLAAQLAVAQAERDEAEAERDYWHKWATDVDAMQTQQTAEANQRAAALAARVQALAQQWAEAVAHEDREAADTLRANHVGLANLSYHTVCARRRTYALCLSALGAALAGAASAPRSKNDDDDKKDCTFTSGAASAPETP